MSLMLLGAFGLLTGLNTFAEHLVHTHTQAESDFLPFLWMSDKMSMDALPFVEFWNVQSRILRLKLSPTVVDRPTQLICISDIYLLTEMFWPVNIYICSICNIRIS